MDADQLSCQAKSRENERRLEREVLIDESLVAELEAKHVKFNREGMRFIVKDRAGTIVWLENGDANVGLEHIVKRHAGDFAKKANVAEDEILFYPYRVISSGEVVESRVVKRRGRKGYSRTYFYNGREYVLAGVGSNGFIVSAYPVD